MERALTLNHRVLIIEDSMMQAHLTQSVLNDANLKTHVIYDPRRAITTIESWRPDLILMDLYMPHCSGIELASLIRKTPAWAAIPIIFFSLENDLEQHLSALDIGADDFLTKPIQATHLIRTVVARITRAKTLQSLMEQDSLTGLLNHASILEKYDIEKARASREKSPLTVIMMDVDHFKKINDSYGHLVGDEVLQTLSRFLQDRLRKTDLIGRYGGEEFLVLLPGTPPEKAHGLLDDVRLGISKLEFLVTQPRSSSFSVTLSAGIAGFNPGSPEDNLPALADERLYLAKKRGRNQIVMC